MDGGCRGWRLAEERLHVITLCVWNTAGGLKSAACVTVIIATMLLCLRVCKTALQNETVNELIAKTFEAIKLTIAAITEHWKMCRMHFRQFRLVLWLAITEPHSDKNPDHRVVCTEANKTLPALRCTLAYKMLARDWRLQFSVMQHGKIFRNMGTLSKFHGQEAPAKLRGVLSYPLRLFFQWSSAGPFHVQGENRAVRLIVLGLLWCWCKIRSAS